jgi:nucleotide-binding universal stress UspA family protein
MGSMYDRILVAIENSDADRTIVSHVTALAKTIGAELLLVHVADGWVARNYDQLKLRDSEEMKADRLYLEKLRDELTADGLIVKTQLAMGDPASELVKIANGGTVDLVAMATHGHRYLADIVHGTTVDRVRHLVKIPVLLLKVPHAGSHDAADT